MTIEDPQREASSFGVFKNDKSGGCGLILGQILFASIIEQHGEVDQLGGEIVDEWRILLSEHRRCLQMRKGLVGVEQLSWKVIQDLIISTYHKDCDSRSRLFLLRVPLAHPRHRRSPPRPG